MSEACRADGQWTEELAAVGDTLAGRGGPAVSGGGTSDGDLQPRPPRRLRVADRSGLRLRRHRDRHGHDAEDMTAASFECALWDCSRFDPRRGDRLFGLKHG